MVNQTQNRVNQWQIQKIVKKCRGMTKNYNCFRLLKRDLHRIHIKGRLFVFHSWQKINFKLRPDRQPQNLVNQKQIEKIAWEWLKIKSFATYKGDIGV